MKTISFKSLWQVAHKVASSHRTIFVAMSLMIIIVGVFLFAWSQSKIIIHKALNNDQHNIVVISKARIIRIPFARKLYADIWFDNKKIISYYICKLDMIHDFDKKIKEITVLPESNEIQVEFSHHGHAKSGTGIDLYKLPTVQDN